MPAIGRLMAFDGLFGLGIITPQNAPVRRKIPLCMGLFPGFFATPPPGGRVREVMATRRNQLSAAFELTAKA